MKRRKGWPQKAVMLAAGYGTRMRPLSLELPKPLMPLWGTPLLEHSLSLLASWGVRDVLINCHHEPSNILRFVTSRSPSELKISLSYEPDIRGTGGVLQQAAWFLDDTPFWMINGDIAADLDPAPLVRAYARGKTLAAVWVDSERGPRTVDVRRGRVQQFQSDQPGKNGTATFCGLHLLSRKVLNFLPGEGMASIIDAYNKAMQEGLHIAAVDQPSSYWADLGTPRQYLDAHRDVQARARKKQMGARLYDRTADKVRRDLVKQGVGVSGFVSAPRARIASGARLKNAVLWPGCELRSSANVDDAIVSNDVILRGAAHGIVMRADRALNKDEQRLWNEQIGRLDSSIAFPLGERGSGRCFTRVVSPSSRAIVMHYDQREENALFATHARFLKKLRLRVPEVLGHDPTRRILITEDLGEHSLLTLTKGVTDKQKLKRYREVIDEMCRLHRRGIEEARRQRLKLMPPFSPALYRWERTLFVEQFLMKRSHASERHVTSMKRELAAVARQLGRLPEVLVHRDFQSTNIIFVGQRPAMIDFQGMRRGPAVYDLASLLCDPYVDLEAGLQDQLLEYYASKIDAEDQLAVHFQWAAIQRLCQALGAYGRLSSCRGGEFFAAAVAPALRQLARVLEKVERLPKLRSWVCRMRA